MSILVTAGQTAGKYLKNLMQTGSAVQSENQQKAALRISIHRQLRINLPAGLFLSQVNLTDGGIANVEIIVSLILAVATFVFAVTTLKKYLNSGLVTVSN